MVKFLIGLVVLEMFHSVPFDFLIGLLEPLNNHPEFLEFVDNGFMEEKFVVFDEIKVQAAVSPSLTLFFCLGSCRQKPFRMHS